MMWMIFIALGNGDPLTIKTLQFYTEDQCMEYVLDPQNAPTLAMEVISHTGSFNNPIVNLACVPETDLKKLGIKSEGLV